MQGDIGNPDEARRDPDDRQCAGELTVDVLMVAGLVRGGKALDVGIAADVATAALVCGCRCTGLLGTIVTQ